MLQVIAMIGTLKWQRRDIEMINSVLRAALVWGFVCFLLLYRTFPVDIVVSWQVLQQYDLPIWQLIATYTTSILPALVPLGCFVLLARNAKGNKFYVISMPFIAWVITRCLLVVILWIITFKISNQPPYSGGLQNIVTRQIVTMYWTSHTLVSALIIMVCSYAFWRERGAISPF
jgi:hypothetical protein